MSKIINIKNLTTRSKETKWDKELNQIENHLLKHELIFFLMKTILIKEQTQLEKKMLKEIFIYII